MIGDTSLSAPTSTSKLQPKKRRKIVIEKGYSQLDWGRLQRSGEDLRVSLQSHLRRICHGADSRSCEWQNGITSLQRITLEELASHRTKDDCWQAYGGKVYDVTRFLKYHPGGVPEMMRAAGKDGKPLI